MPQPLTLAEIAQDLGVDSSAISLSQLHTLLQRQTLGTLANLAGVQDLTLQEVPALQSAFNATMCPELLTLAKRTGDLPAEASIQSNLSNKPSTISVSTTITDLISSPDQLLGKANLGEIQFAGPAFDQLEGFTVGDIPRLDQVAIADLDG